MNSIILLFALVALSSVSFFMGRRKAMQSVHGDIKQLHSLPDHYGWFAAMVTLLPGLFIMLLWLGVGDGLADKMTIATLGEKFSHLSGLDRILYFDDIHNLAAGDAISQPLTDQLKNATQYYLQTQTDIFRLFAFLAVGLSALTTFFGLRKINPALRSRNLIERLVVTSLIIFSTLAILITIGIVSSLIVETMQFLDHVSLTDFLFGLEWSPQTALRADQVASSGSFGAIPLFTGTLLITVIALLLAVPVGLLSAVYMTEFANRTARAIFKPLLELLAGIPTVVYGFFAALVVAPFIRNTGAAVGLESALAAGVVMGIMIIPLISSLSDDVISSVPQNLRDASYSMGATKTETILKVIIPAALPGIVSAFLLAASRAIGETMIVVMAAGMAANLTANPLASVTTVTVQIVALLTGDQEFDSAKTLSAFALGLALFVVTLILNFIALRVVRKYQEQYD